MTMWRRIALVGVGAVLGALGSAYALGYRKGMEERNADQKCAEDDDRQDIPEEAPEDDGSSDPGSGMA